MTKQILMMISAIAVFSSGSVAAAAIKATTSQVCRQLLRVQTPRGLDAEECYMQAKDYLLSKNIKVMTGSYQAYFALSEGDRTQTSCRKFLKRVVLETHMVELEDAQKIFGDDKAYSLDRSMYSYLTCLESKQMEVARKSKSSGQSDSTQAAAQSAVRTSDSSSGAQ